MSQQRQTKHVRVRREFLVKKIQEWHVQIPADYDTGEWTANDLAGFDQYVSDQGELVLETYSTIDDDQLETTVMSEGENL